MDEMRGRWLWRGQIALAGIFALGVAALLAQAAFRAPEVPFIWSGATPWIWPPTPPQTAGKLVEQERVPHAALRAALHRRCAAGPAMLRVRALRDLVLSVNGHEVPLASRDPQHWKEASVVDIAPLLVPGDNILRAGSPQSRRRCPLAAACRRAFPALVTDEHWLAAWEGEPLAPAAIADDGARLPDSTALPQPRRGTPASRARTPGSCRERGSPLPGGAPLAGRGEHGLARSRSRWSCSSGCGCSPRRSSAFRRTPASMPPTMLRTSPPSCTRGRFPSRREGFQTYQPPLYYAFTALLLAVTDPTPGSVAERAMLSLLPVLSGLGMAFVAAAMARLVFPDLPWVRAGTIVVAGILPMSLTLASGASNEAPHALFASLALLVTVRTLLRKSTTRQDDFVLGLLLGLALLTKYTSAILVPTVVGMVAARRWIVERWPPSRIAAGAVRALAVVARPRRVVLRSQLPLLWRAVRVEPECLAGEDGVAVPGIPYARLFPSLWRCPHPAVVLGFPQLLGLALHDALGRRHARWRWRCGLFPWALAL